MKIPPVTESVTLVQLFHSLLQIELLREIDYYSILIKKDGPNQTL